MLRTLQGLELVETGSRRGVFRPGVGLVRLGGSVLTRFDERTVTLPILERLRAQTKETVHLSVRRGYQAVFIERLLGERAHSLAIPLGGLCRCTSAPPRGCSSRASPARSGTSTSPP